jgi:hypothetical protein
MRITINFTDFKHYFNLRRPDNFTSAGLWALWQYLEDVEPDMELDVIGICCDFTEWENIEEYNLTYGSEHEHNWEVSDETTFIDIDGERFIAQDW